MLRMILPITGSLLVCLGVVAADPSDRDAAAVAGVEESASDHQWVAAAEQQRWDLVRESLAGDRVNIDASQPDGMTALHWASYHNHARSIAALVAAGADVDAKTLYEVTPLSLACEYGNLRAVRALLDAGADANASRRGGESPLMLAARQGNANVVRSLIKAGADMEDKEARGQTALMWASAAGNLDTVDALIDAGCNVETTLKQSGLSALMFAARHGQSAVVMRLLDSGLDVNTVATPKRSGGRNPRSGMSAMMFAIESGHLQLACDLVLRGADPNDQRSGYAPLHAITWVRKTELGDNPEGDPAPRITGSIHSLDFVRQMVELGADVNLQLKNGKSRGQRLNPKGATPFFLASRGADIELMHLLLELGADPTIPNDDGTTALMAAAGVGVIAVGEEPGTPEEVDRAIEMLVELGIDPNVVDRNRETAMHGAALRTFPTAVRKLTSVGADPNVWNHKNKRGWTPLDIAGGKRPGSVKPSPPTIEALKEAIEASSF